MASPQIVTLLVDISYGCEPVKGGLRTLTREVSEIVIKMIGVGQLRETLTFPFSQRKPLDEVLHLHGIEPVPLAGATL